MTLIGRYNFGILERNEDSFGSGTLFGRALRVWEKERLSLEIVDDIEIARITRKN